MFYTRQLSRLASLFLAPVSYLSQTAGAAAVGHVEETNAAFYILLNFTTVDLRLLFFSRDSQRQCWSGRNAGLPFDVHVPMGNASNGSSGNPNDLRGTCSRICKATLRACPDHRLQIPTGFRVATEWQNRVLQFLAQILRGRENDSERYQLNYSTKGRVPFLFPFLLFALSAFQGHSTPSVNEALRVELIINDTLTITHLHTICNLIGGLFSLQKEISHEDV